MLAVTEARFTRARIILRSGLITRGNAATSLRRRINVRAVSIARELLGALLTSRLDAGVQQSLRPLEIVCVQRSRRCAVSCGDCVSPRCQRRDLRQHRRGKPYIGGQSRRQEGRSRDLRGGSPATSDVASAIVEHPMSTGPRSTCSVPVTILKKSFLTIVSNPSDSASMPPASSSIFPRPSAAGRPRAGGPRQSGDRRPRSRCARRRR